VERFLALQESELRPDNLTGQLCPCTAGGFWEDSFMAEAIDDKMRQLGQNFFRSRV
jgi:hypothetical protein